MFSSLPPYLIYPGAIMASAIISIYAVRKILIVTRSHKIFDIPDDTRKIHGAEIPSLGGIGIFIGYMMVASFFWPGKPLYVNYFLPSIVLLFFAGIYDDLMNMRPYKKLVAQLVASAITIYFAKLRITLLLGLFGLGALPYPVDFAIATVGCTLFINAFNFIDGIDGLACVLAILYASILGALFQEAGHLGCAFMSFSLAGATGGLLLFNFSPAKIYMGDTGSMLLGFNIFILSVAMLNLPSPLPDHVAAHAGTGMAVIIIGLLFFPVFDAFRVFVLRVSKGRSPLRADRTHLHYYLLDAGFSHSQAVLVIFIVNVLIIATAFEMQDMQPLVAIACMLLIALVTLVVIYALRQRHMAKGKVAGRSVPG